MASPLAVPYLLGLSALIESLALLALLALGLVRPWGVVPPSWVPLLGGRRMKPGAVAAVAGTGAVALVALWTPKLLSLPGMAGEFTDVGDVLIGVLYAPLAAWGPLLGVLAVAYYRRHTP